MMAMGTSERSDEQMVLAKDDPAAGKEAGTSYILELACAFDRLPAELLEKICAYTKKQGLVLLALTCKSLQPFAQAALFYHVSLHDDAAEARYDRATWPSRLRALCDDIGRPWDYDPEAADRPLTQEEKLTFHDKTVFTIFRDVVKQNLRLSRYVHSLTIKFRFEIAWEDIRDLLPKFRNLERLALEPRWKEIGSFPICGTRIKEFCGTKLAISRNLVEFLRWQDKLTSWVILKPRDADVETKVPHSILARITSSKMDFSKRTAPLLQGMVNLTHLSIEADRFLHFLLLNCLTQCGRNLISFAIRGLPLQWVFENIIPLTPALRYFQFEFAFEKNANIEFLNYTSSICSEQLPKLLSIPFPGSLKTIVLSLTNSGEEDPAIIERDYLLKVDRQEKTRFKPSVTASPYVTTLRLMVPALERVVYWKDHHLHSFRHTKVDSNGTWLEDDEPAFDITHDAWKYV